MTQRNSIHGVGLSSPSRGFRSSVWIVACLMVVACIYLLLYVEPQKLRMAPPAMPATVSRQLELVVTINKPKPVTRTQKTILIYTTLFGKAHWPHAAGKDLSNYLENVKCPVKACDITYDKSRINTSDVLVFHARDMPPVRHLKSLYRSPHQRWAYFISENPFNTGDPTSLNGLFNWSMTYRVDSDVYLPYAQFRSLESSEPRPEMDVNFAAGKTKLIGWMVSHCGLLRDEYAMKLDRLIPVEVAGGCSTKFSKKFKCGRNACDETIRKFKFYLAFENGFCHNYVTEKYWHWAIEVGVVPIVMGAGPYTDPRLVIPGSFINVEDFPTIRKLADYLLYLDKNDTAYNEYFKWRQHYKLTVGSSGWPYEPDWTCRMCQMLHNGAPQTKVYDQLSTFWGRQSNCGGKDALVRKIVRDS